MKVIQIPTLIKGGKSGIEYNREGFNIYNFAEALVHKAAFTDFAILVTISSFR